MLVECSRRELITSLGLTPRGPLRPRDKDASRREIKPRLQRARAIKMTETWSGLSKLLRKLEDNTRVYVDLYVLIEYFNRIW